MGFLPWEIQVAFPGESQPQQIHTTQCMVYAGCLSVSIIHQTLDMDYSIFNMRTDVNACDCMQGCMGTVRESALKVDCGRKNPRCTGGQTCVNGMPVWCSVIWVTFAPVACTEIRLQGKQTDKETSVRTAFSWLHIKVFCQRNFLCGNAYPAYGQDG